ncbi:MAG: putative metal-binding motif-containing protein [Myxococcales bacterium]|nr:putative metal-binding motif-containing protein [Myxococcales bacterium]
MTRDSAWFGLFAIVIVACGSSSDNDVGPVQPKPTVCITVKDCPKGTASCIEGFCVAQGCIDEDGDKAGIGPGCSVYDCDDGDPSIPGAEVCNGKDDDCNSAIDEGCPCLDNTGTALPDGSTRPCGGAGDCGGTQTCSSGKWEADCKGAKTPAASEVCGNDVDENCDGQKNEGCCPAGENPCPGFAICSSNGVCE